MGKGEEGSLPQVLEASGLARDWSRRRGRNEVPCPTLQTPPRVRTPQGYGRDTQDNLTSLSRAGRPQLMCELYMHKQHRQGC